MSWAERRELSDLPGPEQRRAVFTDRLGTQDVFVFFRTLADVETFKAWYNETRGNWFAAYWPRPDGARGVYRILGGPRYTGFMPKRKGWGVGFSVQIRGRGELPQSFASSTWDVNPNTPTWLIDGRELTQASGRGTGASVSTRRNGRFYAEMVIDAANTSDFGLLSDEQWANAKTAPFTGISFLQQLAGVGIVGSNGVILKEATFQGTFGAAIGPGDVVGLALDSNVRAANTAWIYLAVNGDWFSTSDPATNTGGFQGSLVGSPFWHLCSGALSPAGQTVALHTTPPSFAYAVPVGYEPWDS